MTVVVAEAARGARCNWELEGAGRSGEREGKGGGVVVGRWWGGRCPAAAVGGSGRYGEVAARGGVWAVAVEGGGALRGCPPNGSCYRG